MKQASKEEKDRAKVATRPRVNNFRDQDQVHLKLNLEFMDNLVATVYAFPDEETCWNFALMSNYSASIKLGRSYRLERNSEHCRLVSSSYYSPITLITKCTVYIALFSYLAKPQEICVARPFRRDP
jgi:hypothetical protein